MTHRIADTFYDSLNKLSQQEQKIVKQSAFDFQLDPSQASFSMHKVDRGRDPNLWTARVNRDIRMVVHKKGGDTLLAWVGHHDNAYRWAETRRIENHPKTGAVQIVEARETIEDVITKRFVEEAILKPRLFSDETDDVLLSWGVPTDWLQTVRDATEDTVLEIALHLPGEAQEALMAAATGERPVTVPPEEIADPWDHPDALRRFRTVENIDELKRALDSPWEKWSVFLHPAQQEFVDRNFNGPARVVGSAGTGKTVVALHRAARLAKGNTRVLLTTFNRRLADQLSEKIALVSDQATRSNIDVAPLDGLIVRMHAERFDETEIVDEQTLRQMLVQAALANKIDVDPDFLFDEWRLIIDAWDVRDAVTYKELPRLGRKVRMIASRRDTLWEVFSSVRVALTHRKLTTEAQLAHDLRQSGEFPYTHVVIDEAQDISVPELMLLGAAVGSLPNGLFFAGDIGQRIFRAPFPWLAAGVDVRGRSRSLKVNYRTSHQIRVQSDKLLPETLIEADGEAESRLGVTSVFEGPAPQIQSFENRDLEIAALREWLNGYSKQGINPNEMAILVRQSASIASLEDQISIPDLVIMSMHEAKGSEYRVVAIACLDHNILPDERRFLAAKDESQLDEVMTTERHLLYVAATRARDYLWMSGVEPVSEFLNDLMPKK
ncbi:AAA family ATPase [Planktomarina temperata]|nr:AAA family ATPase [Planktomarina temperata]